MWDFDEYETLSVLFANSTLYEDDMMERLGKYIDEKMNPGSVAISTTNPFKLSDEWDIEGPITEKASWGDVTVFIHKRAHLKTN